MHPVWVASPNGSNWPEFIFGVGDTCYREREEEKKKNTYTPLMRKHSVSGFKLRNHRCLFIEKGEKKNIQAVKMNILY